MSAEFKAGLFVISAFLVLLYMVTRLTQNQFSLSGTKVYYATVNDATGLLSKTKVKMAGLDVGQLTSIELVEKRARITLEVSAGVDLKKDATITVKTIGFLGDKYLELYAGSDQQPSLPEGSYIPEGIAGGSLDQLTTKTTELVENLKEISLILKEALKGQGEGIDGTRLDRILDNMEQFSQGLAEVDKIGDIADRLSAVVENVREITGRVNRGEGTIGKLIRDSETVDRINETLSGVNKFISKADRLQIWIDTRSAALANIGGSRTQFALSFQPTFDKYYLIGVTARPQGITKTKTFTTTTSDANQQNTTTVREERVRDESSIGINAQFAKRFGDFFFRFGLFETTGGLAVDYHFWEERARLSTEVYRFSRTDSPQLNVMAEAQVWKPFFLWTGGDYILSRENRSFFIGGGLRFNDQDLKSLVTAAASSGVAR